MREHVQFSFHKYGAISFSLFGSVKNYLCPLISLINLHAWSIVPRPANIYIIQNVGAFDLFYLFNYYYYYFIFLKGGGLICLIEKDSKKWRVTLVELESNSLSTFWQGTYGFLLIFVSKATSHLCRDFN